VTMILSKSLTATHAPVLKPAINSELVKIINTLVKIMFTSPEPGQLLIVESYTIGLENMSKVNRFW